MFEDFIKPENEQIKADFSDDFFWVQKPQNIYEKLLTQTDLFHQPVEPFAQSLCKVIANQHQIPENNVMIFQGIQSALFYIVQLIRDTSCTLISPISPQFEEVANYFKLKLIFNEAPQHYTSFRGSKLAFLANPNLINGSILYTDELEEIFRDHPETVFVIDESFIGFCKYSESIIDLIKDHNNLIVLKSLSDQAGVQALNLCYLAAHKRIIEILKRGTPAFLINTLNLQAGKLLFEYIQSNPLDLTSIHQASHNLAQDLEDFDEFEVSKSYCHYFLVKSKSLKTKDLKKRLWDNAQFLIDDLKGVKNLDEYHFRICALNPEKNDDLITVIKAVIQDLNHK